MIQRGVADILKGIVRTQLLVFVVAFCAIASVAAFSLGLQYRLTAENDRELVRWHLHDRAEKIQNIAVDYAFWDDTYNMAVGDDAKTLQRDVTGYLSKVHAFDMVAVIGTDGRIIATTDAEDHGQFDFFALFRPEIDRISASRNDRMPGQENISGASLWIMLHNTPHLVALSPIYTTEQFETRTLPKEMAWLMIAEAPNAAFLDEMARRYRLEDIALTYPGTGDFNNELPIVLRDGTSSVAIAWNSRPMGIEFARHMIPLVLFSLLVLFGFGWRMITRTQSVGHSLDRLHVGARLEQARLRSLFDNTQDALVVHDEAGVILDCNDQISKQTGLARTVLISQTIQSVFDQYPIEKLDTMVNLTKFDGMIRVNGGDGIPVEIRLGNFGYHSERHFIASARDVSERLKAEKEIWHMAHHDALTDLPNRALFGSKLAASLMRAVEDGIGCALLYIDLDGFKAVNDTHGHDAGDALLLEVANRFRSYLREGDMAARLGGDEFAVILPNVTEVDDVTRLASDLLERLSQPYDLKQGLLTISASVGIALAPIDGHAPEPLIKAADNAMYQAKRASGGRYHLASHGNMPVRRKVVQRSVSVHRC